MRFSSHSTCWAVAGLLAAWAMSADASTGGGDASSSRATGNRVQRAGYNQAAESSTEAACSSPPSSHMTAYTEASLAQAGRNVRRSIAGDLQESIAALSSIDPVTAANEVLSQPGVRYTVQGNGTNPYSLTPGDGGATQLPWNTNVPFQQSVTVKGSQEEGWHRLPKVEGFELDRSTQVYNRDRSGSGIMPFYVTSNRDTPGDVKRAIVLLPGKPRDAWNYASLMLNARSVVVENRPDWAISNSSVMIVAPVFMSQGDMAAGAGRKGEISFQGEEWQKGSYALTPAAADGLMNSYDVIDHFVESLFNKTAYPNLNQVVVAGHSLGGQMVMRYALLKPRRRYDDNLSYWTANAGSFAWLDDARPYAGINSTCEAKYRNWPFGIGGDLRQIPSYARPDVKVNSTFVKQRYLGRKVHYAFGLLDEGAGTTACAAQWQGSNHIDRGSNFVLSLVNQTAGGGGGTGAIPASHTVDYIANVSHQPYAMYSSNVSLTHLFYTDFNVSHPDLTDVSNPGDSIRAGVHLFATVGGSRGAIACLVACLVLLVGGFAALLRLSTPNYDESWEQAPPNEGKRDWDEDLMFFAAQTAQARQARLQQQSRSLALTSVVGRRLRCTRGVLAGQPMMKQYRRRRGVALGGDRGSRMAGAAMASLGAALSASSKGRAGAGTGCNGGMSSVRSSNTSGNSSNSSSLESSKRNTGRKKGRTPRRHREFRLPKDEMMAVSGGKASSAGSCPSTVPGKLSEAAAAAMAVRPTPTRSFASSSTLASSNATMVGSEGKTAVNSASSSVKSLSRHVDHGRKVLKPLVGKDDDDRVRSRPTSAGGASTLHSAGSSVRGFNVRRSESYRAGAGEDDDETNGDLSFSCSPTGDGEGDLSDDDVETASIWLRHTSAPVHPDLGEQLRRDTAGGKARCKPMVPDGFGGFREMLDHEEVRDWDQKWRPSPRLRHHAPRHAGKVGAQGKVHDDDGASVTRQARSSHNAVKCKASKDDDAEDDDDDDDYQDLEGDLGVAVLLQDDGDFDLVISAEPLADGTSQARVEDSAHLVDSRHLATRDARRSVDTNGSSGSIYSSADEDGDEDDDVDDAGLQSIVAIYSEARRRGSEWTVESEVEAPPRARATG